MSTQDFSPHIEWVLAGVSLQNKQLHLIIGSSILGLDKLKKVDLFIGAENTWQGTIGLYTNHPLIASGVFSVDAVNQAQYTIYIRVCLFF